jgi:hypothetical protein
VQTVVGVLQRNKVPLLSVVESCENRPLVGHAVFQAACRAEEQELTSLRTEYKKAKEALAAEGIADVMIKSVGLAPSFPYRSDNLDVLYRPRDVQTVRAVLCDMGYVELKNVEEPLKYLFRKFHAGCSASAIHLHAHVGWMVSFLDEEALWQRCAVSMDDPLVTVPAAEDALLTTLAHYFYEDKCVALLDLLKFAHCLRRGVDWDEVYRVATWRGWRDGLTVSLLLCAGQERALYGETLAPLPILERALHELPGWARAVLERRLEAALPALLYEVEPASATGGSRLHRRGAVAGHLASQQASPVASTRYAESSGTGAAGRSKLPVPISFVFSKIFFYAKLLRDPTRSALRKLKDLMVHTANGTKLRLRIHSQPRMLITLSGIDGSGKTTQARMLCSAFKVCHLRVDHVWSRGGSAQWLRLVTWWGRKRADADEGTGQATPAQKVRSRQRRFRSPWVRAAWSWFTSVELLLRYARCVTLPLLLGHVVVCDRYIYDTFADWSAYFGEQAEQRLAARILRLLTPRPRHRYWLDISPDEARLREGASVPEDFVAVQSAAYGRMAVPNGLKRLDGSCPKEALADQVAYEVLDSYFSDYSTLVNYLLLKNPGQWR